MAEQTVKTVIVYREKPSSGIVASILSVAFSLLGIFTPLAVLALPLAILLMLVGLVRGVAALSLVGITAAILALFFVIVGYATSPGALLALAALFGLAIGPSQ
jgi:hypothetical protein